MYRKIDQLTEALALLENEKEIQDFLVDLLTPEEIERLATRWQVIRLVAGGSSRRDVQARTQASLTTISRVNRVVTHGTGIIETLIDRHIELHAYRTEFGQLAAALTLLENEDEVADFLSDFLTSGESERLATRWQVMWLVAGGSSRRDVQARAQASLTTISRVNRVVTHGTGIIKTLIDRHIELHAHGLEDCADVEAISRAYHTLVADELAIPASALLRSFSRISRDVDSALRQESSYNQRLALRAIEDRLDGLLRELTRSSERYALRFRPIVAHWRQIIADHVRQLAKAVELRQEIDSPYIVGMPLTEQQDIFVGRTDISERIEQSLLDRRRPSLLLYGQRRMGKTSVLNNLGRLLPSTIVPLFVDLQGPATRATNHAGFLYNVARGMVDSAQQQRNLALPSLPYDVLTTDPFTRFDEWLNEVEQALEQTTALLALDEFEALESAITKGRFDEEAVLGTLRHLIQHRPRFKVLLAGSHTLNELQRWASYLINVQVVHISYLREDEARQLIERPVKDFALRYEPDASQRVLDLTRGHPFLVQLLCAEIVALKNEQPLAVRRLARLADVEAAVPEALSHGGFFFADIQQNQVDAAGLAMLCFLAAQGEGAVVRREALARQFPNQLDRALGLLVRRELIEPSSGGYRFQVELIRRWFAR